MRANLIARGSAKNLHCAELSFSAATHSEIMFAVTVVAANWVHVLCGPNELFLMPLRTVVISTTRACAVTPRHKLREMLVATTTKLLHGPRIIALIHMLHREHSEEAGVAWAVMTIKAIIMVRSLQERKFGFTTCPTHFFTKDWIVLGIVAMTSLLQKLVRLGIVGTARFVPAAQLKMAGEVGVPEVRTFVIRQHVHRLMYMPQTESAFVRFQISFSHSIASFWVVQRALAYPIDLGAAFER